MLLLQESSDTASLTCFAFVHYAACALVGRAAKRVRRRPERRDTMGIDVKFGDTLSGYPVLPTQEK